MAGASEEKRIGDYLVGKHELGRGTYGKVYLGTHVRTGKHVAAKKFTWEKQYLTEEAEREACLLMRIPDHENLVQLLDYIKIDTEKGGKAYVQFWMIVEYCPLGHLQEFAEKKRLSVCEKVNLATQCAHAVYHLHSQVPSVIHRDLKPKNILVVGSKKRPVVKLADLGESKLSEKINNETQLMSSVRGTSDFMAPEMFAASPSYNKSADVFSLGVTFLSVLDADSGVKVPKVGRECLGRYLQSQAEGFRYDITKSGDSAEVLQVKGVLSAMLEKDPASRLQIQQVLEHLEYLFITLRASQLQIPNDAAVLLKKNVLKIAGKAVQVEHYLGEAEEENDGEELENEEDDGDGKNEQPRTRSIRVTGINKPVENDHLKLFFEKKSFGGGEVVSLNYNKEKGTAIMVFASPEDAANVLSHGALFYKGNTMTAVGVEMSSPHKNKSCAVIVHDIKRDQIEHVENFLENKRCADVEIESRYYIEQSHQLIVTFPTHEDVQRLLGKRRLMIPGKPDTPLKVEMMKPKKSALIVKPPVEKDKVLVQELTVSVTPPMLKKYMKKGGQVAVSELIYGLQPGVALCVFEHTHDLKKLKDHCASKPIADTMVAIQSVPLSNQIQVHLLDGGSAAEFAEKMTIYFESSRSGGGPVEGAFPKEGCVIIQFRDKEVMESVLYQSQSHKIGARQMHVAAYYECLGVLPPDLDTSTPDAWVQS